MAQLKKKRKLGAVAREAQEEHPRNGQSQNTSVPGIEEYITHVSEKVEGRVIKKLSKEFSRTEFNILGALFKLDKVLFNPQIRTHSGTVKLIALRNVENQGPNEDGSQDDPHPGVGLPVNQSRRSNDTDPDEAPHRFLSLQRNKTILHMLQRVLHFLFFFIQPKHANNTIPYSN